MDWFYKMAGLLVKAVFFAKSKLEQNKSNKIAQFDTLNPIFLNVQHLLNAFSGKDATNSPCLVKSKDALKTLSDAFVKDDDLQKILLELQNSLDNCDIKNVIKKYKLDSHRVNISNQAPENLNEIKEIFERKKEQYLNIG